jgi:hypothetical protein
MICVQVKKKISTAAIVAIAVPIADAVVLFTLGYFFIIRRKTYDAVKGEIGKEYVHRLLGSFNSLVCTPCFM